MKKILCPTDFSETANQAIGFAANVCKKVGAELTLLNIQSVFSLPPVEVIKGKFLATEPINGRLEEQSYQVMKMFKITCLSEVEPSNKKLTDIIAQHSKDFDLMIMGTNGADDNYEFFFGSRSYQVAKDSSTPILLIPNGCVFRDISHIVFAFDYEHENTLPMEQVTEWAKLLEARITVLQVKQHYTVEAEVNSKEIQRSIEQVTELANIQFDTIYSDNVIDSINSYVLRNEIDSLALCSIHHGIIESIFHKSVIKALSSTANYPIFVFHK
ncbi:MAG: universal stress protein [Bacteroidota bacterium]